MSREFTKQVLGTGITAASTITPATNGNTFNVAGATTVGTVNTNGRYAGQRVTLFATDGFTLTHNGTSMKLSGAEDKVLAAGECVELEAIGTNQWREVARGSAVVPGMVLIEEIVAGSGGLASFDFTSIPGTFKALQFMGDVRCESANEYIRVAFNNDTGNNYSMRYTLNQDASNLNAAINNSSAGPKQLGYLAPGGSGNADASSMFEAVMYNYANTNFHKNFRSAIFNRDGSTTTDDAFWTSVVRWASTTAITRVTFSCDSSDFAEHSRIALWGLS